MRKHLTSAVRLLRSMPVANARTLRPAFTVVELLLVLLAFSILFTYAVMKYKDIREDAYIIAMQSDLRRYVLVQEEHYQDSGAYQDSSQLRSAGFAFSTDVRPDSGDLQTDGFYFRVGHLRTEYKCDVSYGAGRDGKMHCYIEPSAGFDVVCNDLMCTFTDRSVDRDGSIVTRFWEFGDGETSTDTNPTHLYERGGVYTIQLTVTDNDGASNSHSAEITVVAPPKAGFDFECVELTCEFVDQSTDDYSIASWHWDFGDANTSTSQNPTHTYASWGTWMVTLTVTDNDGLVDSYSQAVFVNATPSAGFTFSCNDLTCSFTDQSSDPDGSIVNWHWDFGDGNTSSSQHPTHTYAHGSARTVTLTVTDDGGATAAYSQQVISVNPNIPPVANFTYNCSGLDCSFTDQSSDSDGSIVSWSWSFGDGGSSTAKNPSHTYASGGTKTVTLTVTDNNGATDTYSQLVTVTRPNQNPRANFTFDCTYLTCLFTDASSDPDPGDWITSWLWEFGDGQTSTLENPIHTFSSAGTRTVQLTVRDNRGAFHSVSKSVSVQDPPSPTVDIVLVDPDFSRPAFSPASLPSGIKLSSSLDLDGYSVPIARFEWQVGGAVTEIAPMWIDLIEPFTTHEGWGYNHFYGGSGPVTSQVQLVIDRRCMTLSNPSGPGVDYYGVEVRLRVWDALNNLVAQDVQMIYYVPYPTCNDLSF